MDLMERRLSKQERKRRQRLIEERKVFMSTICRTCLSMNRRTYDVEAVNYAYDVMTNWAPRVLETRVCWECRAVLGTILKFKKQALQARNLLETALLQADQDHTSVAPLTSLSCLRTATKNSYDKTYVDNTLEETQRKVTVQDSSTQVDGDIFVDYLPETETDDWINTIHHFSQSKNSDNSNRPPSPVQILIDEHIILNKGDKATKNLSQLSLNKSDKSNVFILGNTSYDPSVPINCDSDDSDQADDTLIDNLNLVSEISDEEVGERMVTDKLDVDKEVINKDITEAVVTDNVTSDKQVGEKPKLLKRKRKVRKTSMRIQVNKKDLNVSLAELEAEKKVERFTSSLQQVLALRRQELRNMCKIFKCQMCVVGFKAQTELDNHMQESHSDSAGALSCDICNCRFKCEETLTEHYNAHFSLLRCTRPGCKYVTGAERKVAVHVLRHDSGIPGLNQRKNDTTCDICGGTFKTRQYLLIHRNTHVSTERYECDHCGRVYKTRRQVHKHLQVHARSYMCETCGKRCITNSALKQHNLSHLSKTQREYECVECQNKYATKYKLLAHMAWHRGETVSCSHCDKKYYSVYVLNAHMRQVHPDKVAEGTTRRLKEMEPRTKSGFRNKPNIEEYKLECDICGKKFKDKVVLRTHFFIHTNEMPYKCDECGKGFKVKSSLNIHMISHRGEKPYQCSKCDKTFVTHTGMKWHESTHANKKHECTVCGVKVHYPSNLTRHMKKHKMSVAEQAHAESISDAGSPPRAQAALVPEEIPPAD